MNIDIKLKTYEQLQNEVITLNTNSYLKDLKIENLEEDRKQLLNYVNQLQSNWNSLREWLKNKIDNFQDDVSEPILHEQMTMRVIYEYMENLDKMNELEGKK